MNWELISISFNQTFAFRERESAAGPVAGDVEGEERRPRFPTHRGPGHGALAPVGQGSAEGGRRVRGGAGGRAVGLQAGRGGRRRPHARRFHL